MTADERSLTLRAYAEIQKRTYRQSTEDIAIALNASIQSCGHVLGMMAKRGFLVKECRGAKKWWTLPAEPYSINVVAATMNRTDTVRAMARQAKYEAEHPQVKRITITLQQLEPMLPPPVHPLDQAWKVIYAHLRANTRRLALVVSNPPGPDAGLASDS